MDNQFSWKGFHSVCLPVCVCFIYLKADGIRAQRSGPNSSTVNKYISAVIDCSNDAHLIGWVLPVYYSPWKRHVWQLRSVQAWTAASLQDDRAHGPEISALFFLFFGRKNSAAHIFILCDWWQCVMYVCMVWGTRSKGSQTRSIKFSCGVYQNDKAPIKYKVPLL